MQSQTTGFGQVGSKGMGNWEVGMSEEGECWCLAGISIRQTRAAGWATLDPCICYVDFFSGSKNQVYEAFGFGAVTTQFLSFSEAARLCCTLSIKYFIYLTKIK